MREYGQFGGVSRALELVGERWALLIVRDLLVGPRRYGELAAGLPRIPTNILATRLKELQAAGVLRRAPRSRVIVYELTEHGRALEPVVLSLAAWGLQSLGDAREEQVITPESMTVDLRTAFRPDVAQHLPSTAYAARLLDADLRILVDGPRLEVVRSDDRPDAVRPADLTFTADANVHRLITGRLAPGDALATGAVRVLDGRPDLLSRFARTFRVAS